MARWTPDIETVLGIIDKNIDTEHFMESFFQPRNYKPKNDQERKVIEEFSLVASSMVILIHVAKADKIMHPEERKQIIDDLIYQFEQRPFEYKSLSEKFGVGEREIITNMYNVFLTDYENGKLQINDVIDKINLIYQNNPDKRNYIIRLCYFCALSDNYFEESEDHRIKDIALRLNVPAEEVKRIELEVIAELKK